MRKRSLQFTSLTQGHWLASRRAGLEPRALRFPGAHNDSCPTQLALRGAESPEGAERAHPGTPPTASALARPRTRTECPRFPHGAAGWHIPTGCLQPWATATGPLPARPRASFEHVREAHAPCGSSRAAPASAPVRHPPCVQSASNPVQEDSERTTRPLSESKEGPYGAERQGAVHTV